MLFAHCLSRFWGCESQVYNLDKKDVTWEWCTLRKYLNGEFLQKFTREEQDRIIKTTIHNPENLWYSTPGGNDTPDKIFLLSLEEVDGYFGNSGDYQHQRRKKDDKCFSNAHDTARQIKYGDEVSWWWLRSPGSGLKYAAMAYCAGIVNVYGFHVDVCDGLLVAQAGGVRPALWLNWQP